LGCGPLPTTKSLYFSPEGVVVIGAAALGCAAPAFGADAVLF